MWTFCHSLKYLLNNEYLQDSTGKFFTEFNDKNVFSSQYDFLLTTLLLPSEQYKTVYILLLV